MTSTSHWRPGHCDTLPDYYWRDYNGTIPYDALEGGRCNEEPFYVGQGLFRYGTHNEMLVAAVVPGKRTVEGLGHGTTRVTDKHVKVLCGRHQENFEWRPIEGKNLHLLTDANVIVGGDEVGSMLHIGRVMHKGRLTIGKVYTHASPYEGLWVAEGAGQVHYTSFEILVYN